jgi:hypothetical protein
MGWDTRLGWETREAGADISSIVKVRTSDTAY